ncbi:ABC transporter substrate-binding protein [Kurthia sibirica]|uniref:Solute-binding protein family 5 domain-containing protein n=1 Tax=Kurthia sibirica TaxID=202750 RepID=A0A2U3ALK9_9BACL|nr:ABC transporter substrate-binding protein [Kurthia sibirica]PWI25431.1 hypothetical protein DEX24_08825 [Kurthia sibirica]GEK34334.1 ABC transporter substrate-binding protein [Kurthia sibirica]
MKKNIRFTVLCIVFALLSACSNSGDTTKIEKVKSTMTVAYEVDTSSFDPILSTSGGDHVIQWPIYESLINFDANLNPKPGLAKSWEIVNEKKITMKLEENVVFHDGTPFNAQVVKENIERMNSKDSLNHDIRTIDQVVAVDEYTVDFLLKVPDVSILMALADRGGMMTSPKVFNNKEKGLSENPVGTGPFKFKSRVPNAEVVYEKNKEYWGADKAKVEQLIIKVMADENARMNALRSGEIDFMSGVAPSNIHAMKKNNNLKVEGDTTLNFKMLYINNSFDIVKNKDIRLAILYAIDRQQLVKVVNFGQGEPASQVVPSSHWAYIDDFTISFNVEKSKELIVQSGILAPKLEINHYTRAFETRLAEVLKTQLETAGFTVKLNGMETISAVNGFFKEKNAPIFLSEWTGRTDVQMPIKSLFSRDSFFNTGASASDRLEALIERGSKTFDEKKRKEIYKAIYEQGFLKEAIFIPIMAPTISVAFHKNVIGYEPNITGKVLFSKLGFKDEK